MKIRTLLLAVPLSLLLSACPEPEPEPEPGPETVATLPDAIPTEWMGGLSGTVSIVKEYTSGPLNETTCTEVMSVAGTDISAVVPEQCEQCDLVWGLYLTVVEDCPGGDDLADEGEFGADLRQTAGEAVMWWFFEGGWFSDSGWEEIGTAGLSRTVDQVDSEDPDSMVGLTIDMHYSFDDPGNGETWSNNWILGGDCAWDPCSFNAYYTYDLAIDFEVDQEWLDSELAAE